VNDDDNDDDKKLVTPTDCCSAMSWCHCQADSEQRQLQWCSQKPQRTTGELPRVSSVWM